jgi:hypothetical protein
LSYSFGAGEQQGEIQLDSTANQPGVDIANPAFLPEDPKSPVDKINHDLNIKPAQLYKFILEV